MKENWFLDSDPPPLHPRPSKAGSGFLKARPNLSKGSQGLSEVDPSFSEAGSELSKADQSLSEVCQRSLFAWLRLSGLSGARSGHSA